MSGQVKGVTDVVKDIAEINNMASTVAEELRKNLAEVKEALTMTQDVSKALRDAGAELRGVLGAHSNNPQER
jgi:ABC-type transporter Mla subunit MlaD